MKKRSLWILFITALLCLTMLFAACDSNQDDIEETSATETESVTETESGTETDAGETTEAETEEITEEPEVEARPSDVVVNHENAIGIWESYFTYVGTENTDKTFTSAQKLFEALNRDTNYDGYTDVYTYINSSDNLFAVEISTAGDEATLRTVKIYDVETGKEILSRTENYNYDVKQKDYTFTYTLYENYVELAENKTVYTNGEYGYESETTVTRSIYDLRGNMLASAIDGEQKYYAYNNIYNIVNELYVSEYVNDGTEEEPNWNWHDSYTYTDRNGTVLAENLSERAEYDYWDYTWNSESGEYDYFGYIRLEGKNYYFCAGEIIFTDENPAPHMIPAESNNYAWKIGEQNGYGYYAFGYTIQVVNTNTYKIVANYEIPARFVDGAEYEIQILANGNVYFVSYKENEDFYDFETSWGDKYRCHSLILDITTGKAEEIETTFIPVDFMTPASLADSNMKIKEQCHYAAVYNIVDGKLADEVEFVILNSKLEKLATLPKLIKNQVSFEGMIGSNKFIVSAQNVPYDEAEYLADGNANTVTPYWNGEATYEIENGFVVTYQEYDYQLGYYTRYVVYNYNMSKVAEFTSAQNPRFEYGKIYLTETSVGEKASEYPSDDDNFINDDTTEKVYYTIHKIAYVDKSGTYHVKEISSDNNPVLEYVENDNSSIIWSVTEDADIPGEYITDISIYNSLGSHIATFNNASDISVAYRGENTILLRVYCDEGAIYYIIK